MLEAILKTAVAAIVTIDSAGLIDSVNPATTSMFGYAEDELLGRNVKILMPEPYASESDGYLANYLRTGERKIIGIGREVMGRRKDGSTFPVHLAVSEFQVDGKPHFAGIITDLSARQAAQTALKESERRLVQAHKMEAVGQLAGGIAHDFNNLLTIIQGNLELMEERVTDEELRGRLHQVQEAVIRGADLTRRLLGFSRQLPLEPKNIELNLVVTRTSKLLRRTIGEHIVFTTVLGPALWVVRADPTQVESSLMNLAINARDAMPNGGRLLIETRNVTIDADQVAAGLDMAPGDYVALAVTDTGTGIPPDILPRVFEPFFTTKPKGRGTGLGLAMIYGFAKQSGGHVTLYSEVGHGTTVTLYLPTASPSMPLTREEPSRPERAKSGVLVLLVEDDANVRRLSSERLRRLGHHVTEASSGAEALDLIKGGQRPDLVFTDMIMPGGLSGRDLVEQITAIVPSMRFLLTSGYSEEMVGADGRAPLPLKVLQKPYRMAELAIALSEALAES
jgi:PAS domain S-box-containing protein